MRLAVVAGVLGILGLVTASAGPATSSATFEWVLTKTEINPARAPQPAHARLTVRNGHIDYDWFEPPQAEFDISWKPPPGRVKPGARIVFTVTAVGRITGGTDTHGYRTASGILHFNDRWVDSAVEIGQSCVDPIGVLPISCTQPVTAKGTVSRATPTYGTKFTIGIGLLNCSNCVVRYTYTSKSAGTTKPKPKPPRQPEPPPTTSKSTLDIDWTMQRRYGIRGDDGLIASPTPKEIASPSLQVDLVVRSKRSGCREGDTIVWSAPGAIRVARAGGCRFTATFRKEGRYRLTAWRKGRDGVTEKGEADVLVQDWLVFGLGDSNGSGEGAPDIPSPALPSLTPPKWQSLQCDRSAYSYQAQTARSIENADPKTSVTFAHFACSGASIEKGLLGAYGGINPKAGPALGPQVFKMQRLANGREIDAVVISVGVNDLGFASLVEHCILYPSCYERGFPKLTSPTTLDGVMQARLNRLPALYDSLSRALKQAGVPAPRVYVTEYFDSTRDASGNFCDPLIEVSTTSLRPFTALVGHPFLRALAAAATSVTLHFDRAEAQWAHDRVLARLNQQVRAAASKHGWGLVAGVADAFRNRGYCAGDGAWVIGLFESLERQHDHNGTLHANPRGNTETAKLAVKVVRKGLYPVGKARPPK